MDFADGTSLPSGLKAMNPDHIQNLKSLRDHLVEDRRAMVTTILADPQTSGEISGEFVGLQHFIDAVERALSHEAILKRPEPAGGPSFR
jgi:hypothetical protein